MTTEKKKLDRNKTWSTIMTMLPIIVLTQVGMNEFDGFIYGLLGAGLGSIIGTLANYLSKDRSLLIKIISSIVLVLICGLAMKYSPLISLKIEEKEEREIIEQKWVKQQIGGITFESPTKLLLRPIELPQEIQDSYLEFKVYSAMDVNEKAITKFISVRLTEKGVTRLGDLLIENIFVNSLEGILNDREIDLGTVEIGAFIKDGETVSTTFSFGGKKMQGYGFLLKKGNIMDVIWLIPIYRGFSDEYIEKFKKGIVIN